MDEIAVVSKRARIEAEAVEMYRALDMLVHRIDTPLEFGQAEELAHRLANARAILVRIDGGR